MSHSIRFNENFGVVVVRYRGSVDFSEIRSVFDATVHITGFKPGLSLVVDFRDTSEPLTGTEVIALADYARRTDANWGVAKWLLIAEKDVTFGLARMFSSLTSNLDVQTKVFRNAAAADDWLGIGARVEDILALTPE